MAFALLHTARVAQKERASHGGEAFTLRIIFGYDFTLNYQETRSALLYDEI